MAGVTSPHPTATVLLTGATGFVGAELLSHLRDVPLRCLGGAAGSEFELTWIGGGSLGEYSSQSSTRSSDGEGSYTGTLTFRLRHTPH